MREDATLARSAIQELVRRAPAVLGRRLDDEEVERFDRYLDILLRWNRIHRLVGSNDPVWIVERLLLDSLLFTRLLPPGVQRVADLGSGPGIPGIPLKIVSPGLEMVLIEARRKRVSFLRAVIRNLNLTSVEVFEGRLEPDMSLESPVDAVVSRCAGQPVAVARLGSRLVRAGGIVIIAGAPRGTSGFPGEHVEVLGRHFLIAKS